MRIAFVFLAACCFPFAVLAKPAITVGVSLLPQKYFVEQVGGDDVAVIVLAGAGFNHVTYEPKPKQLAQLKQASIYFLAEVSFEKKWVSVFEKNNPEMMLVPLTKNIKLRKFQSAEVEKHYHEGDDHHGNIDPHFWLNPALVQTAAKTILDTLVEKDPERQGNYTANYLRFIGELGELDKRIREKMSTTKHKSFAVFHPSWGYFAEAYGLQQIAIEVQNRQSGAKTLNETINKIKDMKIPVIFVQKQFSTMDAQMIATETGARLIQVDPLAEDYIANMDKVSKLFSEALH